MIPFFPREISNKGIIIYFLSLMVVTMMFISHAMPWYYIILGIIWTLVFFLLTPRLSRQWGRLSESRFVRTLFFTALGLRVAWVFFSYLFYTAMTGSPFEFGAADAVGYHGEAEWLADSSWDMVLTYYGLSAGVSDLGYSFYLQCLYRVVGPSIIIARLLKAIFSSITCILIYRLASRNIGEYPGRMAGIFAAFMPNLIIYCGLHLKETEMIFLTVAFLERADFAIRGKDFSAMNLTAALLLAISLFFFRTVLGVVALFSLVGGLLFSSKRIINKGRKVAIGVYVLLFGASAFASGTILQEIEGYWEARVVNAQLKTQYREARGAQWAKYATTTVMAPMAFVMPFATMVDTGQDNQMLLHAGNFIRNFLGFFVLLALYITLFRDHNWRDFSLIGIFVISYLGIIAFSGYGNAERFLLPGLPCLLIMAAYGISQMTPKFYKYLKYWYIVVFLMEFGWAFFKLGNIGAL